MKLIIKALLTSVYYLEISDELDDCDGAMKALIDTATYLKDCSTDELESLKSVIRDELELHTDTDYKEFCEGFIEHYIDKYEEHWA